MLSLDTHSPAPMLTATGQRLYHLRSPKTRRESGCTRSFRRSAAPDAVACVARKYHLVTSGTVTWNGNGLSGVSTGISGCASTNSSGYYSCAVNGGGNYTVTPTLAGYTFSPASKSFNDITGNNTQNFTATQITYTISGTVAYNSSGLSGVSLSGCGSGATTNSSGAYSITVGSGTTCTLTPTLTGYAFSPSSKSFSNITSNQTQNFTATLVTYTISGTVSYNSSGLSGVSLSGCGSGATTNASGSYSVTVTQARAAP